MSQSEQFCTVNKKLLGVLSLRDNPYNIVWLYMIYINDSQLQKNHFILQFFKIAHLVDILVKQLIFNFAFFSYLRENRMTIPKRKMKYLSLMIIKKQLYRMNMAQVAHSCKIVMRWKGKIDKKIYPNIFLKKFENIFKI